ncbi:unnamed protein product [Peronospora belbahrii]|uniref:U4/U6.U5 small nuclear ribonucleoprotein 27kDa protein domain-containing protein n=1 Tax=Peronospora belbahrii TaxID=622444 RepID=A0AAU9KUR0_9STRA|nr:unnamed protein product [Peronospora belbahrii]
MPRSRSGSLDSLGRRRRRNTSSHRRRRPRSKSSSHSPSRSASRSRGRSHRSRSRSRGRSRSRSIERRRRRRRSYSRSRSPILESHKRSTAVLSTSCRPSDTERAEEPKIEPNDKPNAMSQLCEEEQMKLLLGFEDFDSTKGKNVEENVKGPAVGTVRRDTKREYRQYMNRRGGFNRPLDKV